LPTDILIRHEAKNPQTRELIQAAAHSVSKDAEKLMRCVRHG